MQTVNIRGQGTGSMRKVLQMCRQKAKAGGQKLQGINQKKWGHSSSLVGQRGSCVVVLRAVGNCEMLPVGMEVDGRD